MPTSYRPYLADQGILLPSSLSACRVTHPRPSMLTRSLFLCSTSMKLAAVNCEPLQRAPSNLRVGKICLLVSDITVLARRYN
jgi:hypothetical protein